MTTLLATTKSRSRSLPRAFTLIELLVVIAIIALLIGILLPALGKARDAGRSVKCQSNMRGLSQSLVTYANDYRGMFPPTLDNAPDRDTGKFTMTWYDENRIGKYLPQQDNSNILETNTRNATVGGGIMQCPNHPDAGRSYTMNYWASSAGSWVLDSTTNKVVSWKPGANPSNTAEGNRGKAFDSSVDNSSQMLLLAEAWGLFWSETEPRKWFTIGQVGIDGTPGQRFGAGFGITGPGAFPGQWLGQAPEMTGLTTQAELRSYIPYYRHPRQSGKPTEKTGGVNLGFADGHVAQFKFSDLADGTTGKSTLKVLWSPKDPTIN
jgi:prepilin-type N-terminal cleavage/methylation domain-containing protein/prepilin-type processing-associated H-X9-DG protein